MDLVFKVGIQYCKWEFLLNHLGLVCMYFTFLERQTGNLVTLKLFSDSLGFCQIFLDCPVETCLKRNGQRPQPLPDETIQLMERKIEKPNPEKNAWEHNSLVIQSSACSSEARYSAPSPFNALLLGTLGNICLTVWGSLLSHRLGESCGGAN